MIKNEMSFPLAVDTATVKATTNILYTATDEELKAYTIGYIPWEMMQKSVFYRGLQYGDFAVDSTDFKYTIDKKFRNTKGVPFCYSYASSPLTVSLDAFNDGNGYIDLPWGTASTAGLLHAYNTDYIVNNTPNQIANTYGIRCYLKMLVAYVPEGGEGGASTSAGENGWCTWLPDKNVYLDLVTLAFSVTSGTDGGYMPTGVTFTQDDLRDAVNGVMSKSNGTTVYGGVTYNITVYCAINWAEIEDNTATNLKDGFAQCDKIRASHVGGPGHSPLIKTINNNSTVADSFTCNAIEEDVDIQYPASTLYYIGPSEDAPEYFKFSGGLNQNWYIAGSLTLTDLKIIRSIARPVYKISGSFYVAEFNDDFTITGDLIPYANAREWQKNINGDTNTFDFNNIPEPGSSGINFKRFNGTTWEIMQHKIYGSGTEQLTSFPAIVQTSGEPLTNYTIYGNTGGVGDLDGNRYVIPVTSGGVTTNLYTNSPLGLTDTLTYTDTGIVLPTIDGDNTITFDTTVQPSGMSATFKGWHPVQAAKKYDGSGWK